MNDDTHVLMYFIFGIIALGAYLYQIYRSMKQLGDRGSMTSVIVNNLIILAIGIVACRYIFPGFFHEVFFEAIWLHINILIYLIVAIVFGCVAYTYYTNERYNLTAIYGVTALAVGICGYLVSNGLTEAQIASTYRFATRPNLVETDPNTVRYTPHAIAYHLMIQRNIYSQFTIEQDYLNPIDVDGGFGYAAPITPDGTLQHFTAHTPGVMTFDDRPTTPDDKRVTQSNPISEKEWAYGLQMYPFDNLELHLYRADPTTEYQIYYLDLSTTTTQNPGAPPAHEFVAVASRTKYRFQFPLVFIPYWDGVTLVHANGDIEQLSARQAEQDPRLKGKRLFPEELARTIVKAQSFDEGLWSGYINRPGKIKIPDMPVGNQMPFFTDGKDGHSYWVVATEPAGNSHSLFRIYYIDTNTGERTCFKYNTSDTIVGPEKALDLVEAAPALMNVSWNNHLAMEPVYLSRDGKVYWKVTVTVNNLSSITATAVVDAANNNVQVFQKRDDFEDWLRGKQPALATPSIESGPTASLTPAQIEQVREAAQKIISILGPPKK